MHSLRRRHHGLCRRYHLGAMADHPLQRLQRALVATLRTVRKHDNTDRAVTAGHREAFHVEPVATSGIAAGLIQREAAIGTVLGKGIRTVFMSVETHVSTCGACRSPMRHDGSRPAPW